MLEASDQASDRREREIRRLVSQLADFSRRCEARRRLLLAGKPAVAPLSEALDSPIEGGAWAAARTLGQLRAEEAVEPLVEALSNDSARGAALEALRNITGRDYGEDAEAWRNAGLAAGARSAAAVSDEELARALSSETVRYESSSGGYTFTCRLSGGRSQKVRMMLSLKDADSSPLVAFYTECGPASDELLRRALKMNLRMPFGAFALREGEPQDRLVMVDAYLREEAGIRQLARAMQELARRADRMEKTLSDEDNF